MRAILVCGSRNWEDRETIRRELFPGDFLKWPDIVIQGGAEGADRIASLESACVLGAKGVGIIEMPAQWNKHGRSAGPKRNAQMLRVLLALGECGYSVSVLAFPIGESRGTRGMIAMAEKAGVDVRVIEG